MMRYVLATAALLLMSAPALAAPTVTVSPNSVAPGGKIIVSVSGAGGSASDWLWLVGATPAWEYLTGSQTWPGSIQPIVSADLVFTAPTTAGPYTATFYANNDSKVVLATASYTVTNTPPPPPGPVTSLKALGSVSVDKSTGDVTITGNSDASMALCSPAPAVGSACGKGASCYNQTAISGSTDLNTDIYVCVGATSKWSRLPTQRSKTQ